MDPASLKTYIDAMQEKAEQNHIEAEKTIATAIAELAKIAEEAQRSDLMKG